MKKIFFSLTVLVFCGVLFLSVVDFNLNKPYYLLDIPYSKWQLNVDKKTYPRIFCMILTHSENLKTRAKAVEDAWATNRLIYRLVHFLLGSKFLYWKIPNFSQFSWEGHNEKTILGRVFSAWLHSFIFKNFKFSIETLPDLHGYIFLLWAKKN
jgi:hypothetical protein